MVPAPDDAPLRAVENAKTKKPPAKTSRPCIGVCDDLIGGFACGARHWTPSVQ
jgi:hypothetical protein